MWGKLGTHLTPWRVLNVTPSLAPTLFCPRLWHWAESVIHHVQERLRPCPGAEKTLYPASKASMGHLWFTHCVYICMITNVNQPLYPQTRFRANTLQLDLSLHLGLFGVYKSLHLCLCSHSPCLSYIPKEAITSLASASPWAVVIVTCGLVDMTWSRDRW